MKEDGELQDIAGYVVGKINYWEGAIKRVLAEDTPVAPPVLGTLVSLRYAVDFTEKDLDNLTADELRRLGDLGNRLNTMSRRDDNDK